MLNKPGKQKPVFSEGPKPIPLLCQADQRREQARRLSRALAHDNERCPQSRVRFLRLAAINEIEHGLAHGFGAAHFFVRREPAHRAGDELDG